jgi:two-component system, cell cycle response regulator DivK
VTTVALVEDNADNRLLVRVLIGHLYEVDEYESGAEALGAFAHELPDLILLDISLLGISGLEVLARLRADARLSRLPVVALTAHAAEGERAEYMAAGFDDYVTKPIVDETILLRAIEDALARIHR